MTDEELKKAIDTDSLWENLVQLTDNLNDYSIFHQVINRDENWKYNGYFICCIKTIRH